MKKNITPAKLLCQAIGNKASSFCGNRPDVFIFVQSGFLQCDWNSFLNIEKGYKIYIELRTGQSGAFYNKVYHRAMFLIDIGYVTDHTNIVRDCFSVDRAKSGVKHGLRDEYHAFTNLSVSITQVSNFIKEFLTYLQFGVISLRTISNTSILTIGSMFEGPDEVDFWRWVSLARI